MAIFHKEPTPAERREINSLLAKASTCCKRLEATDSIDRYFTEWDKYMADHKRLVHYAHKGIKFSRSPTIIHAMICKEIPRVEKDVVNRGYDRLQRDMAKLSTDKAKQNKAKKFFDELAFYYPRLKPGTVQYIESLKARTSILTVNTEPKAKNNTSVPKMAPRFCSNCGTPISPNAQFCVKCGNKLS